MRTVAANRLFRIIMVGLLAISCAKHALTFFTGPTAIVDDAAEYWTRGARVRSGDWLQLSDHVDYRTPLYPIFIGVMQAAFGTGALCATAIVQHVLSIAAGCLIASTCYEVSRSRLVTVVGYAVAVLCVTRVWYANVSLTGTLFMFLLTAMVRMLASYYRQPSLLRLAAVGALLGASTLVRPIPQMLWVPLLALVLLQGGLSRDLRRKSLHVAAALGAMLLVLAPALIRNYLTFDSAYVARVPPINKWVVCFHDGSAANLPIPRTESGQRLLALLPELDGGDAHDRDGYRVIARLKHLGLDDDQIHDLVDAVCFDAIRADPALFTWQAIKRLGNFWRCTVREYPYYSEYELDDPASYQGQKTWRVEPFATWYENVLEHSLSGSLRWLEIEFAACIVGTLLLVLRRGTRLFGLSLALMFIYFSTITALLEVESYRYRMVLEPCIVVAIVAGLLGHRDWSGFSAARQSEADLGGRTATSQPNVLVASEPAPAPEDSWRGPSGLVPA